MTPADYEKRLKELGLKVPADDLAASTAAALRLAEQARALAKVRQDG